MTPLNPWVLEAMADLPVGRGYRFEPAPRSSEADPTNPRDPHHDGVSRPLRLDAVEVAHAATDGATYCCGVTLEAWWRAVEAATGQAPPLSPGEAEALLVDWFCPVMGHDGVADALVKRGWGESVAPEEAQPGDFVQYWRSVDLAAPSGHSAVFLGWREDRSVLRYASSQPATNGVGEHEESVGPTWRLAFVRAWVPGALARS